MGVGVWVSLPFKAENIPLYVQTIAVFIHHGRVVPTSG